MRDHKTVHIFLLEILAVFIGISASLFINDWRQERDDRNRLNHVLEEIYTNAVTDRAGYRFEAASLTHVVEATTALAFGETTQFDNDKINEYFGLVFAEPFFPVQPAGFDRLLNSDILADLDLLRADLDYFYRDLQDRIENARKMLDVITDSQIELFRRSGWVIGQKASNSEEETVATSSLEQRVRDLVQAVRAGSGGLDLEIQNADAIREALKQEEVRSLLRMMISLHLDNATEALEMEVWTTNVINSIQTYAPNIRLPVVEIGVDGTATGKGFSNNGEATRSVVMSRSDDDPDKWYLTINLVDGDLQFRANNSWDFSWGAPVTYQNSVAYDGNDFVGDPADVFPLGKSEFYGLSIPVSAGRYKITFNSHTFEYSFENVGGTDE